MRSVFKTKDADLAAYLYAQHHPLLNCSNEQNAFIFVFPPDASVTAEAYYSGDAVPAKNLFAALHRFHQVVGQEMRL